MAQSEERLGCLNICSLVEDPIVRVILDGNRRSRAAQPQGDLDLAARCPGRARGRQEGVAGDQEHGRRERRGLAHSPRRSHQARAQAPRVSRRRWRADSVPVQRCTVHKAETCSRILPPGQRRSLRTTIAIEHLHEEFKRQIKT